MKYKIVLVEYYSARVDYYIGVTKKGVSANNSYHMKRKLL